MVHEYLGQPLSLDSMLDDPFCDLHNPIQLYLEEWTSLRWSACWALSQHRGGYPPTDLQTRLTKRKTEEALSASHWERESDLIRAWDGSAKDLILNSRRLFARCWSGTGQTGDEIIEDFEYRLLSEWWSNGGTCLELFTRQQTVSTVHECSSSAPCGRSGRKGITAYIFSSLILFQKETMGRI